MDSLLLRFAVLAKAPGDEPIRNTPSAAGAMPRPSFGVEFTDCSELASITTTTTIATAKARTVVPTSFTLAGAAGGVPFVVRVANGRAMRFAQAQMTLATSRR
jgi:hypothetical protein